MTIGAGRVILQDLPRIDAAVADGALARNAALLSFIERLKESGGRCHLMGLVSPGGVHSHQRPHRGDRSDRERSRRACGDSRLPRRPRRAAALGCIDDLPGFRRLARRSAERADRDGRRPLLRHGSGPALGANRAGLRRGGLRAMAGRSAKSAIEAVRASYAADIGDEFVEPAVIRRLCGNGRRRRADHGELPRGPRAPDRDGAARPVLRGLRAEPARALHRSLWRVQLLRDPGSPGRHALPTATR